MRMVLHHCLLDQQFPNPKNNQEIAGQARNDAVGKYRHLINGMTLVFSLYSSDIAFEGGKVDVLAGHLTIDTTVVKQCIKYFNHDTSINQIFQKD
jgi:hypothetical protein